MGRPAGNRSGSRIAGRVKSRRVPLAAHERRSLMSTIHKPGGRSPDPTKANPYFYGWRDIWVKDERGRKTLVRQALTEEDILHPRLGDHVSQNPEHADDAI